MTPGETGNPGNPGTPSVDLAIPGLGPASRVARGGSAIVYRAHQEDFGRDVAVKVFDRSHSERVDEQRRQLDNERHFLGTVTANSGAVTVLDGGVTGDGSPYLLFPFFERGSLHQLVRRQGPLDVEEAGFLLQPIADTLSDLHAAGVVHRDLKPGNILLTDRFRPRLTDFGVAAHTGDPAPFAFTPGYSAPEAALHTSPTMTSCTLDVYGFAATAWFTLTGEPPTAEAVRREDPAIPAPLQELLRRCLAEDPIDRPPTGSALAAQLRRAVRLSLEDGPHTALDPAATSAISSISTLLKHWWWTIAIGVGSALLLADVLL